VNRQKNKFFICTCGHLKSDHIKPEDRLHPRPRQLGICYNMSGEYDKYYTDNCQAFVLDNLKYLEMLSEA
jgi:hypothetical protein